MKLKQLPFDVSTLVPKEAKLQFSTITRCLKLRPWSFKIKHLVEQEFGEEKIQRIFAKDDIIGMAEIVYNFCLYGEDRHYFEERAEEFNKANPHEHKETGFTNFLSACCSVKDAKALNIALVESIGWGEPELEELQRAITKANEVVPGPKRPAAPMPQKVKTTKRKSR